MNGMGDRIKRIRKTRNVTQTVFAKELGISQAYVSKLEQDKENPSDLLLKNPPISTNSHNYFPNHF